MKDITKTNTEIKTNNSKGEVILMKTTTTNQQMKENREFMEAEGYLLTTQDILSVLSKSEGFKSRNSKNFARVLKGMAQGKSVISILSNPASVGVPANQMHYFHSFIENNKLSKRVYTPKRKGVLAPVADFSMMEERNGKLVSTIDYTVVNEVSYKEISESFLSEQFAGQATTIEFTKDGHVYKQRVMLPMHDVFFVSSYVELPEDEADYSEEDHETFRALDKLYREGFYYLDATGEERHAEFLLRTPSQARTLNAIFINNSFITPREALKMIGTEIRAYGKEDSNGLFVVDVSKMMTRPGLAGTNTIASQVIDIGSEIEEISSKEYRIVGGLHTVRVVEDRQVWINEGKYRAWDADKQEFREFNAAEHPVKLTPADGALFADEEIYYSLLAEFGTRTDAWQIRLTPFGKGLMVFVPGLREFYGDHIVALQSAVKGDYRQLFQKQPNFKPQLRIAMFNGDLNKAQKYMNMPYQFTHATSLTAKNLFDIVKPHLDRVEGALQDPAIMKEYVGLNKVIDPNVFGDEVAHYMQDKSRVSTFTTFLDQVEWSYDDPQMKQYAVAILQDLIKGWKQGEVPVRGHYRYMIQDPYAVLEAGTKYETRDAEGDLIVEKRAYHIQPEHAYILDANGKESDLFGKHVALGRNPMVAKGEFQVVKSHGYNNYINASKKGAFMNLCVMSAHDLLTFAMGGADNDGDTCGTIDEPIVVEALLKNNASPIMDISFREENGTINWIGDGCPYSVPMSGVYNVPAHMIEKQKDYKIFFTKEQDTDALYDEVLKLGADYVIRTLKPNKIGLATNIATILADGARGLSYLLSNKIDEEGNPLTQQKANEFMAEIKQYLNNIDLMRLVQGWEIDAAKHGGAYAEVMKETLFFMENPPERLSQYKKAMDKRVWVKPQWLADRKGQFGQNTNSVLGQLSKAVGHFESTQVEGKVNMMMKNAESFNLLPRLAKAFQLEQGYFEHLANMLTQIKGGYGRQVRSLMNANEEYKQNLYEQGVSKDVFNAMMQTAEKNTNSLVLEAADAARDQIDQLMQQYPAKDIGYVAYYITYTDNRRRGLSFPWSIAREAFMQTLLYVDNYDVQSQSVAGDVVGTNLTIAMCVPDDGSVLVADRQKVVAGLQKFGGEIKVQDGRFKVFINGTEAGFIFNSKSNNATLLGHDKFRFNIKAANLGNGTRTLNLDITQLVKA